MVATPARPAPDRCGLSELDPVELGTAVVRAWDDFLDVVRAGSTDLSRPSRVTGLSGKELLIHLGNWPGSCVVDAVIESARSGGEGPPTSPEEGNDQLVAAHRGDSEQAVIEALVAARDRVEAFFGGPEATTWGRTLARSTVGPLPVLSLVHAGTFELAVHALDLAPCGAPAPSDHLLDRGLAALIDITGHLAGRAGIDIALSASTPSGGWAFASGLDVDPHGGWTTSPVPPGPYDGVGVSGPAADLLDAAAGRHPLPTLLMSRRLHVQQLQQWLRLAPLLDDLPGLPGGSALSSAVSGLSGVVGGLSGVAGGVGRALSRFRR
ncbi:MAG: uncharacterized protein JWN88_682 [Frankiales bacterium]|jgi:hypothetical protein|nr:uncharacterized protein [Frankiales bacterium]